jgi:hypothetical protein
MKMKVRMLFLLLALVFMAVTQAMGAGIILQDDFTGTPGAALNGAKWNTTWHYYAAPPNTSIGASGTEAQVGCTQADLGEGPPPYPNGTASALGGGLGAYGYQPTVAEPARFTVDNFYWRQGPEVYGPGSPQEGNEVDYTGFINISLLGQDGASNRSGASSEVSIRSGYSGGPAE